MAAQLGAFAFRRVSSSVLGSFRVAMAALLVVDCYHERGLRRLMRRGEDFGSCSFAHLELTTATWNNNSNYLAKVILRFVTNVYAFVQGSQEVEEEDVLFPRSLTFASHDTTLQLYWLCVACSLVSVFVSSHMYFAHALCCTLTMPTLRLVF